MVNVTYGQLSAGSTDGSLVMNPLGTDIIATVGGTPSGRSQSLCVSLPFRGQTAG